MATLLGGPLSGIQGSINDALGLNNASPAAADRVPLVWDSTLREIYRQKVSPVSLSDRAAVQALAEGQSIELTVAERARFAQRRAQKLFIKNTKGGLAELGYQLPPSMTDPVSMLVNPNTIDWKQGKRYSEKKLRKGSVFWHFANKKGQANDILRLTLRGSTGNIDLRREALDNSDSSEGHGGFAKLMEFYKLYLMSREPETLPGGIKNRFYLSYTSPLFPGATLNSQGIPSGGSALQLTGFFDSVINFSETAGKPNSRDYDFMFVVEEMSPSIEEALGQSLLGLSAFSLPGVGDPLG